MLVWIAVPTLFSLWIISLAVDWTLGGANHAFLLAGIALILLQARQARKPGPGVPVSPRPRPRNRPSSGGRLPGDPP